MSVTIGGISLPGILLDIEIRVDRNITWVPITGAAPCGIPLWITAGAERDIVELSFSALVDGPTGSQIEASLPPAQGNNPVTLMLTGSLARQPIPGFGAYANGAWTFSNVTILSPPDPQGRKVLGIDQWEYRFRCSFLAQGNERVTTPTSTLMPSIVGAQFATYEIQDQSEGFQPLPVASPVYRNNQHGKSRDVTINLRGLTPAQMESAQGWYRAVRAQAVSVSLAMPFAPNLSGTAMMVLREMRHRQGTALMWDGEIEATIWA